MPVAVPVDRTAAHEAGHAITALALGIEVEVVWVRKTPTADGKYGWTEELSDKWRASSGLSVECQIVRLIIQKAAGLAGEATAELGDASTYGAEKDLGAIAKGLLDLGVLRAGELAPPALWSRLVAEAAGILDAERAAFDALRTLLLKNVGGEVKQLPRVNAVRDPERDRSLLVELRAAADALRAAGKLPTGSS